MVLIFVGGGCIERTCCLSMLEEGVTFVISARGGRVWRALLSLLMEVGRGVFDIVDVFVEWERGVMVCVCVCACLFMSLVQYDLVVLNEWAG